MPIIARPIRLRMLPATLGAALLLTAAALASEGAHPTKKAEAPAVAAKPATPASAPAVDPMEVLREKLAEKLGAGKAAPAPAAGVVRVVAKADATPHAPAARPRSEAAAPASARRAEKVESAAHAHEIHWSYGGPGGPENWGNLKPEFAQCSNGKRQSPIDIRGGIVVDLAPIRFDYRPSAFGVVDNGHTVQVNVGAGNSIEIMGRRFDLVQFHFHRPSEERIDGRQFDMVAHLVHRDLDGRIAVIAVLFERGGAHPVVQSVWNNLPLERGDEVGAAVTLDPNALLPKDRRYYTYMGSLTTPPCSEGVLWMVLMQPSPISAEQIGVFARLYPMNARPIQAAAGRLIKQSN